jgi:hypothetical protein
VSFDVSDKLLMRFSVFVRYWRKNESTIRQFIAIHRLQENLKFSEEGSIVRYLRY